MSYFETKDSGKISELVYQNFQDNLRRYLPIDTVYRDDDVWSLAAYKEDRRLGFDDLLKEYQDRLRWNEPTEVVNLFRALGDPRASPEALAQEVLETCRKHVEHFYPETPRKPVVVRINVDLYYQIETEALPVWLEGDGIVKAVEVAFDDVGPVKWGSFASTGVLKQTPSEIKINKFVFDH